MQHQDLEVGVPVFRSQEKKQEARPRSIDDGDTKESLNLVKEESISEPDQYLVVFEKDDPADPLNWSFMKKFIVTGVAILLIFNSTVASSIPSGVIGQLQAHFGLSSEVSALAIALFVLGFLIGPILWGPLSEHYGRRPISLIPLTLFVGTQIGCALSPNTAAFLIFRLLGGIFAASPLSNSGAVMSDVVTPAMRGQVMAVFTVCPFAGPAVAPIISGWMDVAGVNWVWVFWFQTIFAGFCLFLTVVAQPETYAPLLLAHKAERMRKETGDDRWWAPLEKQQLSFLNRVKAILGRPFVLLATEPMLTAITFYMSFIYGVVYLLFEAYPIVFTVGHNFNNLVSGLMFVPIPVGGVAACVFYIVYIDPIYQVAIREHHPNLPPPEHRLHAGFYGAIMLPISFLWFAWTSFPSISYWAPMMAGFPLGMGVVLLYLGLFSYLIDVYLASAASALASTIIVRSLFGAVFPLFANQMFEKLNARWAGTLLGLVAVVMAPIPFILHRFGPALRARSKANRH
ncbi:hypothetical protein QCA50_015325 [Cerrena zonata]|uniref:Major facilitator superfamily (MFS) profile domain-containing protein n=1 Tax=Cerrena zonata TaxID=2478898 RepID=A0AAW0FN57_9APHY